MDWIVTMRNGGTYLCHGSFSQKVHKYIDKIFSKGKYIYVYPEDIQKNKRKADQYQRLADERKNAGEEQRRMYNEEGKNYLMPT